MTVAGLNRRWSARHRDGDWLSGALVSHKHIDLVAASGQSCYYLCQKGDGGMSSSQKHDIDFLDYARGLFGKAVGMLEPGTLDDFSVISGSILLIVGLEKLVKSVIHANNPPNDTP